MSDSVEEVRKELAAAEEALASIGMKGLLERQSTHDKKVAEAQAAIDAAKAKLAALIGQAPETKTEAAPAAAASSDSSVEASQDEVKAAVALLIAETKIEAVTAAAAAPAAATEAPAAVAPEEVFSALPNLLNETGDWDEFEQILNPKASECLIPDGYCCPITSRLMREPVTTSDGHTYEREAIEKWLQNHNTSPLAGAEPLENKSLRPVLFVKNAVGKLLDSHPELKDSKEWYLPESWVRELGHACGVGDEAAIRELVNRDRRLLVHTFDDSCDVHLGGKTALQLAVICSAQNNKALFVVVELLEKRKQGLALAALLQEDNKRKGHVSLHQAILAGRDCRTLFQIMSWMGKGLDLVVAPSDWPTPDEPIRNTLNTLLLWSVDRGDPVKVACLLRLRASPNVMNNEGKRVLYVAVMQQACNLSGAGAQEPGNKEENKKNGNVVQLLLQEGADPNALNADGNHAPLHLALERDLLVTALELARTGHAHLDLKLKDGTSPLHVVASKPTTELADALWRDELPSSSELEATRGAEAHTALHCAAKNGSIEMLRWLVYRGAQVTAVNAKQQNILHLAAVHNHTQFATEAVRLLAMAGFRQEDLSQQDCNGNTPLHLAAQAGASDMVRWLLAEIGGPILRNRAGQLPRQVAESLGHLAVLKTYDNTVAMLKAKDEAVLAQQQGPLGELLLKQHRMIEWQQARLERLEDEILILRKQDSVSSVKEAAERVRSLKASRATQAEVKVAVLAYAEACIAQAVPTDAAVSVPVEVAAAKVRQLKAAKAPQAKVNIALEVYLALKLEAAKIQAKNTVEAYLALTQPAGSEASAPVAVAVATEAKAELTPLEAAAEKVRTLKTAKAPWEEVKAAVEAYIAEKAKTKPKEEVKAAPAAVAATSEEEAPVKMHLGEA